MGETGDLSGHILTIAMFVFYWALLDSWLRSTLGSGGGKANGKDVSAPRQTDIAEPSAAEALSSRTFREIDPDFDAGTFLDGAVKAYETVLRAYAEGNSAILRRHVGPDVLEAFECAIAERRQRRETLELTFVGMNTATIVSAAGKASTEEVAVRFLADVVSVTRLDNDTLAAGDPQKIVQMADLWTFARKARSRDPNWRLVATDSW